VASFTEPVTEASFKVYLIVATGYQVGCKARPVKLPKWPPLPSRTARDRMISAAGSDPA